MKAITLIDVATTSMAKEYSSKVKVSQLLKDLGVDLKYSKGVVLRVGLKEVTMDTLVEPGSTVLVTRNIGGG